MVISLTYASHNNDFLLTFACHTNAICLGLCFLMLEKQNEKWKIKNKKWNYLDWGKEMVSEKNLKSWGWCNKINF